MIMLILRHAWLNLWDKHMTTGRINQVSKIQVPGTFAPELESIDELDSCYKCVQIEIWTQRILLSSHISSSAGRINALQEPKHSARNYPTMQQVFFHSLQIGAKLGILQKYKYKFSNTVQFRRTAGWEGCICQLASITRKDWMTRMLNWNTFSMRRLTTQIFWISSNHLYLLHI